MPAIEQHSIISRMAAKTAGANRYFTGKPCPRGHVGLRVVSDCSCVACAPTLRKRHYDSKCKNDPNYLAQARERTRLARQEARIQLYNREYKRREEYKEWKRAHRARPDVKARELQWRRERQKERLGDDLHFRIVKTLRGRLYQAIRGQSKKSRTLDLLGCTISELKCYLEGQWAPGMSWENYGKARHGELKWHIDHKKPLAAFDLSDPVQLAQVCHYTNLQPLWALENLRKGSRCGYS